jgi:hypothetical protein
MEMTLRDLTEGSRVDHADFLARADILGGLGHDVLISRFGYYYHLVDYLSRYTDRLIGIAAGMPSVMELADDRHYRDLGGGLLESTGRLFKRSVKMYVYPMRDTHAGSVITVETMPIAAAWRHLHDFLLESGHLVPIQRYDESLLSIFTKDVLSRIQSGDASWETMVPPEVAEIIRAKRLFGLKP